MERYTVALPNENEFEFLASVLATWDETSDGLRHKRHALDQLLVRSEIDGYSKERVEGNRDLLQWKKQRSDIVVYVSRIRDGIYEVLIQENNTIVRYIIEEL